MKDEERICGLYLRVSTEDQAKEGFSLPEQKERLEELCKFNGYKIYDYYTCLLYTSSFTLLLSTNAVTI